MENGEIENRADLVDTCRSSAHGVHKYFEFFAGAWFCKCFSCYKYEVLQRLMCWKSTRSRKAITILTTAVSNSQRGDEDESGDNLGARTGNNVAKRQHMVITINSIFFYRFIR